MINRIQNYTISYLKYLTERYHALSFPKKIKRERLGVPRNMVYSYDEVNKFFPNLAPYYPSVTLHKRLGITGKVNSAAVVFNSGLILNNQWGEEIDGHDIVIRINFMPTKGYEVHTGSRTNVRILGRNWIFRESDEVLIHTYNQLNYYNRDIDIFKNSSKLSLEKPIYVFDDNAWANIYEYLSPKVSNGFRAVVFALSLSEKVVIYGGDPKSSTWRRGVKLSHFPSEKDLEYIKTQMAPYSLLHQEYDRYFGNKAMKKGVISTIHDTINREYMFYQIDPRVEIKGF